MELKIYQQKALDLLNEFLKTLDKESPEFAFMHATRQPYKDESFGSNVPFICIKIPTGGGKTLVACHSVGEISNTILRDKFNKGIVMWFVPSEAIKSQTLRKLKDRKDPHRAALDEYFDNNVRVFSNEEALRIRKEDVEGNLCILVSSLDAFRKDKKLQSKYKAYQENGELLSHFENVENQNDLEKDEEGTVINSLANVIRMNKPLIIIDEGHRSKTELSIEFLKELKPSFIMEYTATPRVESNILVDIHSADLKDEKMVKIPIILESISQWQQAVTRGKAKRDELENTAKKEKGEYIRPIALLQAEQVETKTNRITVEQLKEHLIKECKVSEDEIAIKTANTNELEGIDLFSKKCKIRYIITVNALAEGWDCSFAYLLISVANIGSKISVEQIIGRIVRLPNAKEKKEEDLNYSYVFASARNFNEAANEIISGLEINGYSKADIIDGAKRTKKYELESDKVVKEELAIPMMAFEGEKLEFADLIGENFELAKQNHKFEFKTHYDSDGRVKLDIVKGDKWIKERQAILKVAYKDKNFSKQELVNWLDKKLRFIMLDKEDKMKFIEKAIDSQLDKYAISELSVNRFVLRDRLDEIIRRILIDHAQIRFSELVKKGEILVKPFEPFSGKIILSDMLDWKFERNYYSNVDKLNKEELEFIRRLDALDNIKYWVRNREKKDPFYIQGWQPNKFYPDFVAVTKSGKMLALEWKGEDRISNEDTKYKEAIAKEWEKLSKGKLTFYLVGNKTIDGVLKEIKDL